ncbi:hypothetical protein B0H11DRAFT_2281610 [Mycena galericulata]|nr:hypothetical protein B0H11DRAFT_2281610 [Mycena galericulata]
MPFADAPAKPAQTHPVQLSPPGLGGLSVWAYLAMAVVIISIIGVLCYAAYSFHHALNLNALLLPQHSSKSSSKAKRSKKKSWRPSMSSSIQEQPMLAAEIATNQDTGRVDRRMSFPALSHAVELPNAHIPPVAFPAAAVAPSANCEPPAVPMPMYDRHNIRFASVSNAAIYANPKLVPVMGSAVPLSYASQDNLFQNPFTPTTREPETVRTRQKSLSSFSTVFRAKGKGKSMSRASGKENLSVDGGEMVPLNGM